MPCSFLFLSGMVPRACVNWYVGHSFDLAWWQAYHTVPKHTYNEKKLFLAPR